MSPFEFVLMFAVGFVAAILNVLAGGGSLLTMPLLIALGLSPGVANGTARVAVLVQNITATVKYHRAGKIHWPSIARAAPTVMIAGLVGAIAGTRIPDGAFEGLLGGLMLAMVVWLMAGPRAWGRGEGSEHMDLASPRTHVALVIIGLYGGMVQAGVGYIILAAMTFIAGMNVVSANILKIMLVLCYTPIAVAIYGGVGQVAWGPAAVLAGGQALGAIVGARITLTRGLEGIRMGLMGVLVVLAFKTLGGFEWAAQWIP